MAPSHLPSQMHPAHRSPEPVSMETLPVFPLYLAPPAVSMGWMEEGARPVGPGPVVAAKMLAVVAGQSELLLQELPGSKAGHRYKQTRLLSKSQTEKRPKNGNYFSVVRLLSSLSLATGIQYEKFAQGHQVSKYGSTRKLSPTTTPLLPCHLAGGGRTGHMH